MNGIAYECGATAPQHFEWMKAGREEGRQQGMPAMKHWSAELHLGYIPARPQASA